MKTNIKIVVIMAVAAFMTFCSKEDDLAFEPQARVVESPPIDYSAFSCGEPTVVELVAGKHVNAGLVVVANDQDFIYVIFSTNETFAISELHVFVGNASDVPMNKVGVPIPGQFPNNVSFGSTLVKNYLISVPISSVGSNYAVFAHATVTNGLTVESAWSNNVGTNFIEGDAASAWTNGTSFKDLTGTNRWGGYTTCSVQSCEEEEVTDPRCFIEESAWSFGQSFENLTGTKRWGWYSVHEIGKTETFEVFAGQTIKAGDVTISDDGVDLIIDLQMKDAYFNYIHLYLGDKAGLIELCNDAGAPKIGHFPLVYDLPNSTTFTTKIPLSTVESNGVVLVAMHLEAMVKCD